MDPKLLVYLKAYRNTVPVPRHWSQKRKFLQVGSVSVFPTVSLLKRSLCVRNAFIGVGASLTGEAGTLCDCPLDHQDLRSWASAHCMYYE
jgi:hypothetical protein